MDGDNGRVVRRKPIWVVAALLAVNAVLLVAQPSLALPQATVNYFFGPKMIRAEVILKDGGVVHDFRIDRGRIRAVTGSSVTLLERDGTLATIPVAADVQVRLNGRPARLSQLRRGMSAETVRDGEAPARSVHATGRLR